MKHSLETEKMKVYPGQIVANILLPGVLKKVKMLWFCVFRIVKNLYENCMVSFKV